MLSIGEPVHTGWAFAHTDSSVRLELDAADGSGAGAVQVGDTKLGIEVRSGRCAWHPSGQPVLGRQCAPPMQEPGDPIAVRRQFNLFITRQSDIVIVAHFRRRQIDGVFMNLRTNGIETEREEVDVSCGGRVLVRIGAVWGRQNLACLGAAEQMRPHWIVPARRAVRYSYFDLLIGCSLPRFMHDSRESMGAGKELYRAPVIRQPGRIRGDRPETIGHTIAVNRRRGIE
ncbi:MAG: hypothetical protein JWL77_2498 [Chthonomonadaceae bacterium]|nr:hypothetical protein [Chthonomonadaceae bacterium]